jgi:hypothetical protein
LWFENTKTQTAEALRESEEYVSYLEKESLKKQDTKNQADTLYQSRRKNMLLNALSAIKSNVIKLEQLQLGIEKLNAQTDSSGIKTIIENAIPLTLQTKLEKSRINSFELLSHLEVRSIKPKSMKIIKSKEHYIALIKDVTEVNNQLAGMNITSSPDFLDKELGTIENGIVPLKKQTPYTLLMMRVVEIGLPFLLSILSIFLVLRYSLTEKRSREIKDLLNLRNSERSKEENNTGEPSIV